MPHNSLRYSTDLQTEICLSIVIQTGWTIPVDHLIKKGAFGWDGSLQQGLERCKADSVLQGEIACKFGTKVPLVSLAESRQGDPLVPDAKVSPSPTASSAITSSLSSEVGLVVCSTKLRSGVSCSWMRTAMLASACLTPAQPQSTPVNVGTQKVKG